MASLLSRTRSGKAAVLDQLLPGWRELVREMLWELLEELIEQEPETPVYTFNFQHRIWRWNINVSFVLRVKHLRFVVEPLIGTRPQ